MSQPEEDDVHFAEEAAGGDEPEAQAPDPSASDSNISFDDGGAHTDDDMYEADLGGGPSESSSGDFVDDAGDQASYGFESARETQQFKKELVDSGVARDLSEDAGNHQDEYAPSPETLADDGEAASGYSDVAGGGSSDFDDLGYGDPPAASGYGDSGEAEGFADVAGSSSDDSLPAFASSAAQGFDDAPATSEATGFDDVTGEAPAAALEPEPEPEPEPAPVKAAARAAPAPVAEDRPDEGLEGRDDGDKPRTGQVPKSALDDIFARAAELKRRR